MNEPIRCVLKCHVRPGPWPQHAACRAQHNSLRDSHGHAVIERQTQDSPSCDQHISREHQPLNLNAMCVDSHVTRGFMRCQQIQQPTNQASMEGSGMSGMYFAEDWQAA